MSTDRDVQAGYLRAGDRVRYMGQWFDIERARTGWRAIANPDGSKLLRPFVYFDVIEDGVERCLMFAAEHFVAAECMERAEQAS